MKTKLRQIAAYLGTCLRWLALAVLVGCLAGPCGAAFGLALEWATAAREAYPWLLFLLPVAGVAIVALYRAARQPEGGSTNAVFRAARDNARLPLSAAPLIFISTVVTHLFGGSSGREGAALQLGGAISGQVGRLFRLDDKDSRVMTMCGMAAGFSAIFGTPLTATVFTLEVVSVGTMYYGALLPCLVSSLVGVWIAGQMGVVPTVFVLADTVNLTLPSMAQVLALAVLVGGLSIVFCKTLHLAPRLYKRFVPNPYLRAAVGGALVLALTLLLGTTDYNGAGGSVIAAAVSGKAVPWAFVLKMLFTALTLGAGFKGGEIVPVFFTGATFGCVVAPLLGLPASFGAAVGMVALFCGCTNTPLTSILLAIELFGGKSIPLFALACAVSYLVSGYFSLYTEQHIMYSKLRAESIDRRAE